MLSKRAVFITLEGPEGSGKSTQLRWLAQRLRRTGRRVVVLRDPGSTALGRSLRRVLLHSDAALSPLAEALLFIGGRVALVDERIRPALAKGSVVLCDRFHDSTVVYQGFAGGIDPVWLDRVGRRAIGNLMPDLTVILDVPVSQGFARLRRNHDRMERKQRAYHERVRRGFLAQARRDPRRIKVIDATHAPGRIRGDLERIVLSHLS